MLIHEHERRSKDKYGECFTYVHLWLDEFCLFTIDHQKYRHNLRGVEYIKKKWGEKAALIAIQHIEDDNIFYIDNNKRKIPK